MQKLQINICATSGARASPGWFAMKLQLVHSAPRALCNSSNSWSNIELDSGDVDQIVTEELAARAHMAALDVLARLPTHAQIRPAVRLRRRASESAARARHTAHAQAEKQVQRASMYATHCREWWEATIYSFNGENRLPDGTIQVENVRLQDRFNTRKHSVGTLYLTATHLIFVDPQAKREMWILHMHLTHVTKMALTTSGSPLHLRTATFQSATFIIPRERDAHDVYTSLLRLSQPASLDELYAFHYVAPEQEPRAGWDLHDIQSEYLRMGVPSPHWCQTAINMEYEVCDTYPRRLYVPVYATTHYLLGSARFRSRGRFPVLSYLNTTNNAALCRCSQPLAGFTARCNEDEFMLQAILKANPDSEFMYVVDTRPKINAMVNKAAGKGYENESFYENTKFYFFPIENIHVMRGSLAKLQDVCESKSPSTSSFLSGLESSGHLKHIKIILETAAFLVKALQSGTSVLVHCSDGWDRTAQTCSLAGLLLDPYYRTLTGFQVLIEKEWLQFGHKFTDRCGFISSVESKEISPVFTQFLDCVYQLMQQFPRQFQFNERFLITIHDHVYSCQFGTFIGNCQKDRLDLRLRERTFSLWGFIERQEKDFMNPFYQKEVGVMQPVLLPKLNAQSLRFWRGLYNRHDNGVHPRELVTENVTFLKDHTASLEDHIALLEKRVTSLCALLGKSEEQCRAALMCLSTSESVMDFRALLLQDAARDVDSKQSDSESGFEDAASAVSYSMTDSMAAAALEGDVFTPGRIVSEIQSINVDWKPFRNVRVCSCHMPLELHTKKFNCGCCGEVFCARCVIERQVTLPGHLSQKASPVCRSCYKQVKMSPSQSVQDFKLIQSPSARDVTRPDSTGVVK